MNKKHLLMLGAGLMQKPAIEAAKKLGWQVSAADGNPKAVGAAAADVFFHIDLKDLCALENCARKLKETSGLDAVFTAGTDFSASVAFVAEKLDLPGHSYEAAMNATDKVRMRSRFADYAVPSPLSTEFDLAKVKKFEKARLTCPENSIPSGFIDFFSDFPLVVKPVDSMGARGCRMACSADALSAAIMDSISYSRSGRAIVEQYMDGPEFSIDALICDGKLIVCGLADRHIYYPPYFIEMGHTMPSEIPAKERNLLLQTFEKGVRALGLSRGAAKGDIKLTSKGPMIGEIAARLSGGYMSGWTFPYASGLNITEQALLLAAGETAPLFTAAPPIELERLSDTLYYARVSECSAERAWISIPGAAFFVDGFEEAKEVDGVADVFPRSRAGDEVVFPVNNVEKCGNVISKAKTRQQAVEAAEEAARRIVIRLEPRNPATEAFLAASGEFPPCAYKLDEADLRQVFSLPRESRVDLSAPLVAQIPEFLAKYLDSQTDWNRKTMRYALEQLWPLCKKNASVNACAFWKAFVRGGLQGALYIADLGKI